MSGDSSEEKSLPATEHKLRKAREKGQVASSADFVTAAIVTATLLFIVFQWPNMVRAVSELLDASVATMTNADPGLASTMLLQTLAVLAEKLTILAVMLVIVAIGANIVHKKGIPFSVHPVIPDFNRINPAEGMKKLFSVRNATEFSISLVRVAIWFAATGLVMWFALRGFLSSVVCGAPCILQESIDAGKLIVMIAVVMLLVAGLLDIPLQSALFGRDQRMGFSELKRERKDTHGNDEFKAHRRGQYRGLVDEPGGRGVSFFLVGPDFMVGITYDPSDNPLPRVVSRIKEGSFETGMERAKKERVPLVRHPDLAADIYRSIELGGIIRERHFERVALILLELGLVGRN